MVMGDDGRGKSVRPASHSRGQNNLLAKEGSLEITHAQVATRNFTKTEKEQWSSECVKKLLSCIYILVYNTNSLCGSM